MLPSWQDVALGCGNAGVVGYTVGLTQSRAQGIVIIKMPQNGNKKKTNNGGGNQAVPKSGRRRNRGRRQRAGQGPTSALSTIVKHGLNAFHPCHVSLPTPSGKYTVIRTNRTFTTTDYLNLIGPMNATDGWANYLNVAKGAANTALNSGWYFRVGPSPTGTAGIGFGEVVPAACSVQVVCPASLTGASGVVYMGRCQTGLSQPEANDTRTAQDFADALISYSNPKLLSGARLAMSPQQVNLVPSNVAELSDFRELHIGADTSGSGSWDAGNDFIGFKPMFIINPSGVELEVRVCIEWRVRLSPFNPMHNSQVLHPPTAPSVWHGIISAAESVGHGVEDVGIAGAAGYMMSGIGKGFFNAAKNYIGGAARAALPAIEGAAEAAPLLLL